MEIGGVSMTKDDVIEIIKDVTWKDFGRHPDFPKAREAAIQALNEVEEYRTIGTPEECRAAVEKQKAKRPDGGRDIDGNDYLICPNCCAIVADGEWTANFCPDCGQKLDWSDEE